ncbi:MAG TPA: hypothetical protein VGC89_21295, partial [Pyrinomonadaceae bacterium]
MIQVPEDTCDFTHIFAANGSISWPSRCRKARILRCRRFASLCDWNHLLAESANWKHQLAKSFLDNPTNNYFLLFAGLFKLKIGS